MMRCYVCSAFASPFQMTSHQAIIETSRLSIVSDIEIVDESSDQFTFSTDTTSVQTYQHLQTAVLALNNLRRITVQSPSRLGSMSVRRLIIYADEDRQMLPAKIDTFDLLELLGEAEDPSTPRARRPVRSPPKTAAKARVPRRIESGKRLFSDEFPAATDSWIAGEMPAFFADEEARFEASFKTCCLIDIDRETVKSDGINEARLCFGNLSSSSPFRPNLEAIIECDETPAEELELAEEKSRLNLLLEDSLVDAQEAYAIAAEYALAIFHFHSHVSCTGFMILLTEFAEQERSLVRTLLDIKKNLNEKESFIHSSTAADLVNFLSTCLQRRAAFYQIALTEGFKTSSDYGASLFNREWIIDLIEVEYQEQGRVHNVENFTMGEEAIKQGEAAVSSQIAQSIIRNRLSKQKLIPKERKKVTPPTSGSSKVKNRTAAEIDEIGRKSVRSNSIKKHQMDLSVKIGHGLSEEKPGSKPSKNIETRVSKKPQRATHSRPWRC